MTTRIYSVISNVPGHGFHLVEAATKNAALRHVAEGLFQVEVANQKTLVAAMQDGVKIEVAGVQPLNAEQLEHEDASA